MPVTDLVFSGRWPEDSRQEVGRVSGQQRQRDTATPPSARAEERPAVAVDTSTAIEPLRRAAESLNRGIDIQYRQDLGMVVMLIRRKNPETGLNTEEVIRQIPPEDAVHLAQQLESGKATLLDEIA